MKPLLCLALLLPALAAAKPALKQIGGEYERPVWLVDRPGDSSKLFIAEQAGRVFVVDAATNRQLPEPFLDIRSQVLRAGNEEGLLGLDFAPDYFETGHLYVNFSNKDRTNEICRFTVANPKTNLTCDPSTKEVILSYKQPYKNHNGGYLEFGPDGMLYIGTGDGGSANDPKDNGQDLSNLLGKILRIDVSSGKGYSVPRDNPFVNQPGARPEIFAYGLRNPWRCSWDGNQFYIADVGQNHWEEINVVSKKNLKGANFGWRLREGFEPTPKKNVGGDKPRGAIDPVYVYDHGSGEFEGLSINGGYVYRGSVKSLRGHYLFSDHVMPRIWSFQYQGTRITKANNLTHTLARPDGKPFQQLCSFGQDSDNEVYIIEMGGRVWKIIEEN